MFLLAWSQLRIFRSPPTKSSWKSWRRQRPRMTHWSLTTFGMFSCLCSFQNKTSSRPSKATPLSPLQVNWNFLLLKMPIGERNLKSKAHYMDSINALQNYWGSTMTLTHLNNDTSCWSFTFKDGTERFCAIWLFCFKECWKRIEINRLISWKVMILKQVSFNICMQKLRWSISAVFIFMLKERKWIEGKHK